MAASVAGVGACFIPIFANIDVGNVEGWAQMGAFATGAGILVWQLVVAYKRNDELLRQLKDALMKCRDCPLAQAANREAVERITGDYTATPPNNGRLQ